MLIVGSGNVVHNLRRIDWSQPDAGFDWARRFDEAAVQVMTSSPGDVARPAGSRRVRAGGADAGSLHPAALPRRAGGGRDRPAQVLVDGYAMGSLSMTSYTLDARCEVDTTDGNGAPALPDVPADETNM